jgi:hypothetical protein
MEDRYYKGMGVLFMKGRERMWKNECVSIDLFTLPSITNLPELLEPLSLLDGNPTLSMTT